MAAVRLTDSIRYEVLNKIKEMFSVRIAIATKELESLDVGMEIMRKRIPADELNMAVQLNAKNDGWVPEISHLNVTVRYSIDGVERSRLFSVSWRPPCPAPAKVRNSYSDYNANQITNGMACYNIVVAAAKKLDQAEGERDDLTRSIKKSLNACGTLRQLLEIWPTALEFMPKDVIQRHSLKEEKKTKTVINEIDDETKTLLLKTKLLVAANQGNKPV